MTTTGIENMAECTKYVARSSPPIPHPVPIRILPIIIFKLIFYVILLENIVLDYIS